MGNPIVYFEIAGPDGAQLRSFCASVFGWEIDDSATIAARSTGGFAVAFVRTQPTRCSTSVLKTSMRCLRKLRHQRERPVAVQDRMERVIVIGTSCCGKTTFARQLANVLGSPRIELDELYWSPNWVPKPEREFRELTEAATAKPRWVADGNYSSVRDLIWPRATSVVWLNYGFLTVLFRACRRTLHRAISREELFSGNRESFFQSFLSRDSILLWAIMTFRRRRRDYEELQNTERFRQLRWLEFRCPREAEMFLHDLEAPIN